ncbi:winged helix-turn-helix transcriptional regulator [Haladaptatus caseinilyticus]|uniref:winged helix-turn-helix transcriptional regulator n=1 Tax=Haladaptatus caseinilyticus TaxID=2993314 RepID=UPI00224A7A9E|nr:helix-turn-helix domain-containing protein [Haladaptatus caseinilyticus]
MNSHVNQVLVTFVALLVAVAVPFGFVLPVSANVPAHHSTAGDHSSNDLQTIDVLTVSNSLSNPYAGFVLASTEYIEPDSMVAANTVRSYSRYDSSNPLENVTRATIHDAVGDEPGQSLSGISERTNIPRSTVRYHVRILEEERLVETATVRGKHRVYPAENENPALSASLSDDSTATLLDAVARDEPVSVSALADTLDLTPGTVSYHLERLADDELVERERVGNAVVTSLTNTVRDALDAD